MSYFITGVAKFLIYTGVILISGCMRSWRSTKLSPALVVCPVAEYLPTDPNHLVVVDNRLAPSKANAPKKGRLATKPAPAHPALKVKKTISKLSKERENITQNEKKKNSADQVTPVQTSNVQSVSNPPKKEQMPSATMELNSPNNPITGSGTNSLVSSAIPNTSVPAGNPQVQAMDQSAAATALPANPKNDLPPQDAIPSSK